MEVDTDWFPWTVLVLTVAGVGVTVHYTLVTGISPVPTSRRARAAMLAAAGRPGDGVILELGSGWGTLAFPLARAFPDRTVVAYEISPVPWLFSLLRFALFPRPNLRIRRADFFEESLAGASLVVCYLMPRGMARLKAKFEAELGPEAVVVSNTFSVPGWRPAARRDADDLHGSTVYVYAVADNLGPRPPAEASGFAAA